MKKYSRRWRRKVTLLLISSMGISVVYYRLYSAGSAFLIGSLVFIGGYYCKKITT